MLTRLQQWALTLLLVSIAALALPAAGHARVDAAEVAEAKEILTAADYTGGLIVHLGCGDGRLTAALQADDRSVVHGLGADAAELVKAREHIDRLGLYGRVSVEFFRGQKLPHADNLVNLLVLDETAGDQVSREEIMRVLVPGGALCIRSGGQPDSAGIQIVKKPWPAEIDHWTHFLHDAGGNAVAADRRVAPATALQWIDDPKYCRSHEIDSSLPAMVSANGRLIYILDEGPIGITDRRFPSRWMLIARDAFNGVLLWKRPLKPWGWQQWKPDIGNADWRTLRGQRGRFPAEVPRRVVAVGDRVYVTLGFHNAPISILDAATGNVLTQCEGTAGTEEIVVAGDTIFARVRPSAAEGAERRGAKVPTRLTALDTKTGKIRWSREVGNINRLSLAAAGDAVVFLRGPQLLCYDQQNGRLRWETETPGGGILVIHKDVVLTSGKGLNAFSLADGMPLWNGSGTGRDLLVIDDLVWRVQLTSGILQRREEHWPTLSRQAGAKLLGHDFRTGQLRRTAEVPNAMSPGHHLRCYRSKATDRFIIYPKRGAEFLDVAGDEHMRHDWLRGSCSYGILPCNGLLYTPPDQCFCYIGAKMDGLVATSGADTTATLDPRSPRRLVRGHAYGISSGKAAAAADWPAFRADAKRSGANRQANVSRNLRKQWEVALGGKLTQPVVAAGKVFVAAVDRNTVYAFDAATGQRSWKFVAGGRVDSSPTYHDGLLLFGANDGRVYCLDASRGELVWRFLAAPNARRIVAFGRVESPWPVHGTVLMLDSLAYVVAGRSTLVDGGAHFFALQPRTGEVVHYAHLEQPTPDLAADIGDHFAMDGSNIDVLTTDGKHIFCTQEMFDAELNHVPTEWNTRHGDRYLGKDHLIATGGILDDTGFNRISWSYTNRWPGFYFQLMSPKSGNLLVFDSEKTWATKWFVERNIHSKLFYPETTGYLLYCDKNTTQPFLVGDPDAPQPIQWLPETLMKPYKYDGHSISNRHDDYTVEVDKGAGFTRGTPTVWQEYLPVRIEAMALTAETLFAAGQPDLLDPDDPLGALEGRKGGVLLAIDPASGQEVARTSLPHPPRFDGMSAADGRLYMSAMDGTIVCFGSE